MKQFFFSLIFLSIVHLSHAAEIHWMTNYEKALNEAKTKKLPLLLFFTEPDSPWCKKLETEALSTPEFAQLIKDRLIFLLVDFPAKPSDQNKALQKRFKVRGFPTIILLDPNGQQIGITGYRPGGGKEYAEHLLKIVQEYSCYQNVMSSVEHLPTSDLKKLYAQAKAYHFSADTDKIIKKGMASDDPSFFMLERLKELSAADKMDGAEALLIKEKLTAKDPDNKNLTQYHLALIEFENRYTELKQKKRTAESTVAPLVEYVDKWGDSDKKHLWSINIIVSQVLYDQNQYSAALKYAQASYDAAPEQAQSEIAEAIGDIKTKKEYYQ
jgi:thioredoxin-related protein